MNAPKLSVNKICLVIGMVTIAVLAAMVAVLYLLTFDVRVVMCGMVFAALVLMCACCFFMLIRWKLRSFSGILCRTIDDMLVGNTESFSVVEEENLFHKINHHLLRLYEVMQEERRSIAKERTDLQELISDISHQVKTPIANLKMINATLLEQPVSIEKQQDFLRAGEGQLDKLDFLMQAMIKTSRLETGVIALEKKTQGIYETLASALGGILLHAEKKGVGITVDCPEHIEVSHDRKWTGEALFNILDNAVKYTQSGGSVRVLVESWDIYLKIDIADSGKGIPEKNQGMIFKRFYRGEDTHDMEGIGIGLYLAREIITKQGGYIKVVSEADIGTTFSVFLPLDSSNVTGL